MTSFRVFSTLSIRLCRLSITPRPTNVAPITVPMAMARKIAMIDTTWNRKLTMGGVGSGGLRGQWVIEYQRSSSVSRMPSRYVWIGWATSPMTMIVSSAARTSTRMSRRRTRPS